MARHAGRLTFRVPSSWVPMTVATCSSGNSAKGCMRTWPALLTTTSSVPKASRAVATMACAPLDRGDGVVVGHGLAAGGHDLGHDLVGRVHRRGVARAVGVADGHPQVVDHDPGAAGGELQGVLTPEPPPRTGDDRDLAVEAQFPHGPCLARTGRAEPTPVRSATGIRSTPDGEGRHDRAQHPGVAVPRADVLRVRARQPRRVPPPLLPRRRPRGRPLHPLPDTTTASGSSTAGSSPPCSTATAPRS